MAQTREKSLPMLELEPTIPVWGLGNTSSKYAYLAQVEMKKSKRIVRLISLHLNISIFLFTARILC